MLADSVCAWSHGGREEAAAANDVVVTSDDVPVMCPSKCRVLIVIEPVIDKASENWDRLGLSP